MGQFNSQVFSMTKAGDWYNFDHRDGYYAVSVEGTTKDLAYMLFKNYINATRDGYGTILNDSVGPLFLEAQDKNDPKTMCDLFCRIDPEPEPTFWLELDEHIKRFMGLIAFS
jgi:hypothetical protein